MSRGDPGLEDDGDVSGPSCDYKKTLPIANLD